MSPTRLVLLLLAGLAYVLILIFGLRAESESKARQAALEAEFNSLEPFPKATEIRRDFERKLRFGYASAGYTTAASFPEIRKYYDALLCSRGWHLDGELTAGHRLYYSNNRLDAELEYTEGGTSSAYSFNLRWDASRPF